MAIGGVRNVFRNVWRTQRCYPPYTVHRVKEYNNGTHALFTDRGYAGIAGVLFWWVALPIENRFNQFTPGGALYYFDQGLFLIGQCCYLICVLGLLRSGVAGDDWATRAAVGAFLLGQALLVIGLVISLIVGTNELVIMPIGGLLTSLGALFSGVLVLRAGGWRGWTRYAPLALGLYFLALVVRAIVTGNEPTLLLELLWQLPWLLTGLGLAQNAVREQPTLAAV